MTQTLHPYIDYKDSGVPWLGQIPAHWRVRRNKLFLREISDRSKSGDEELLTVSQYTGVTRRQDKVSDENSLLTNAASLVGYKCVQPGDLVMNIMLAWNGSLGVSPINGIVSPAYCVFRATEEIEPRFFHYLLRTPLFTGVFKTVSTGIVESRLRLYPDVFFRLPSLFPPPDEQRAIARFLDHHDRLTRRYIDAQQRLIALLKEQKQALIQQVVTGKVEVRSAKGEGFALVPRSPHMMKDSGIDWLGQIPEHWDVLMNQRIFKEKIRQYDGSPEIQLSLSQRDGLIPTKDMHERSLQTSTYNNWKITLPGDLILNRFLAT